MLTAVFKDELKEHDLLVLKTLSKPPQKQTNKTRQTKNEGCEKKNDLMDLELCD